MRDDASCEITREPACFVLDRSSRFTPGTLQELFDRGDAEMKRCSQDVPEAVSLFDMIRSYSTFEL